MNDILLACSIPSALFGLILWFFKRHIDKNAAKAEVREKNIEQMMMYNVQTTRANNILARATAQAVQRIPDAHCNGDMTAALALADKIQKEEQEFLFDQGLKHIFGD